MLHGLLLRRRLQDVGLEDAYGFVSAFHQSTAEEIEPWFTWTRFGDRHRLAQIDAGIAGEEYRPADPAWEMEQALAGAVTKDPDCLRAFIRAAFVLDPLDRALSAPGFAEKVMQLGRDWRDDPVPAPGRGDLVALAND